MRILLTGGNSFLGSNLVKKLIQFNHKLLCIKRKSSNLWRLKDIEHLISWFDLEEINFEKFFKKNKIDYVIHCATDYGRNVIDPINLININLIIPLKLAHYASKNNVSCFINADTILDKRINSYTLSKKHFLDWLKNYSNNLKIINLAFEHFYGPNDNKTKFASYIIDKLIRNEDDTEIKLTPGQQKRGFLYIDDVVDLFIILINKEKDFSNSFYNFRVGSKDRTSIKEFVKLAKKLCNNDKTNLLFGALPYRKNEIMKPPKTDIKKLADLGWKQKYSLVNGITKTIQIERKNIK